MAKFGSVARVLLETPLPQLDQLFEYAIPEDIDYDLRGFLVKVPLRSGKRIANGYVVETTNKPNFQGRLNFLDSVISVRPVIDIASYHLAKAVAQRQAGTTSDVLRHIIPRRYVKTEKSTAHYQKAFIHTSSSTKSSELEPNRRSVLLFPPGTKDKTGVFEWVRRFTSIALENIQSQKSTIIAVPDFRDLDVLYSYLVSAIPSEFILRTDSKQEDKVRYSNYLLSLNNTPYVIIGNRSVVLSPAHNLGSILVWNESDPLMVELSAPYFHAREVALIRQNLEHCSLLFSSHSRSVATQRLVEIGWLSEMEIPTEKTPKVSFTQDDEGNFSQRLPSSVWQQIKSSLHKGPVLIQVAHKGYSTSLACSTCRERALCPQCHGFLSQNADKTLFQCRRCGHIETDWVCPHCKAKTVRYLNSGSTKTAEELGKAFPGTHIIVSDSEHLVTSVSSKPALVIATAGTEPVAEDGYSLVVLLDGLSHRLRDIPMADEEYLRRTADAISLANVNGKVIAVGSGQELGKIISLGKYREWARKEYVSCLNLRIPPAVRSASLDGSQESVQHALDKLSSWNVKIFGPQKNQKELTKSIIFFDYKDGENIAASLKASIIESSKKRTKLRESEYSRVVELRVKMDDSVLTLD